MRERQSGREKERGVVKWEREREWEQERPVHFVIIEKWHCAFDDTASCLFIFSFIYLKFFHSKASKAFFFRSSVIYTCHRRQMKFFETCHCLLKFSIFATNVFLSYIFLFIKHFFFSKNIIDIPVIFLKHFQSIQQQKSALILSL